MIRERGTLKCLSLACYLFSRIGLKKQFDNYNALLSEKSGIAEFQSSTFRVTLCTHINTCKEDQNLYSLR